MRSQRCRADAHRGARPISPSMNRVAAPSSGTRLVVAPWLSRDLLDRRATDALTGPSAMSRPGLAMPAFSLAISSTVSPRSWVWSSAIRVMVAATGRASTFVASRRPPSPTSMTPTSTCASRSARNAARVAVSKKER